MQGLYPELFGKGARGYSPSDGIPDGKPYIEMVTVAARCRRGKISTLHLTMYRISKHEELKSSVYKFSMIKDQCGSVAFNTRVMCNIY